MGKHTQAGGDWRAYFRSVVVLVKGVISNMKKRFRITDNGQRNVLVYVGNKQRGDLYELATGEREGEYSCMPVLRLCNS